MSSSSKYAPVIVTTLCRYEHFVRCMDSLARCTHADETDVYIGLDYPLKESHWQGYKKILDFLPSIQGFHHVYIQKRERNFGARKNFYATRDYCYENGNDRYIITEDDNEFSPNFLDYVNKGLDKYENNPKVYAICAYSPHIDLQSFSKNIYASYGYSAWGVGLWRNKVIDFTSYPQEKNIHRVKQWLSSPVACIKLFCREPRILYTLYRMINKSMLYGDTCTVTYSILNNLYSVFPSMSKVRNWGNDGSGINCEAIDVSYIHQPIDTATTFDFDDIEINETEMKALRKHASLSWKQWVKFPYQIVKFWLKQGVIYK